MSKLQIDPDRKGQHTTGILTRARDPSKKRTRIVDIAELDTASLQAWLRESSKSNPGHAQTVVQTLLGHIPGCGPAKGDAGVASLEPPGNDTAARRTQQLLVDTANAGDPLLNELCSEVMKYSIDIITYLGEEFDPKVAMVVMMLIVTQASSSQTGLAMWSKYGAEDSPKFIEQRQEQLAQKVEKHDA